MRKALIVLLVILVVVAGIPVPVPGMGSMDCARCTDGVAGVAAACLAVLPLVLAFVAAGLVLLLALWLQQGIGRSPLGPPHRPPRLV